MGRVRWIKLELSAKEHAGDCLATPPKGPARRSIPVGNNSEIDILGHTLDKPVRAAQRGTTPNTNRSGAISIVAIATSAFRT